MAAKKKSSGSPKPKNAKLYSSVKFLNTPGGCWYPPKPKAAV